MRLVVQRVSQARVEVKGEVVGVIDHGLLVFVGIERGDGEREAAFMADKVLNLRIFPDDCGRMNRSVQDAKGEILSISQFTLASHVQKGRRPDFNNAEVPERAERLYEFLNRLMAAAAPVQTGVFGAMMQIHAIHDGPVTLIIEKKYGEG